ncbi:MAG: hypothetical protein WCW78_03135 [Candidatus Paceibacterota bacterium]|jgi:adenylate kinase family enzyme
MHKRILIVGDAGRGKSTFAERLSKKTGIPCCSTDDFYWKVKFTEPRDQQESVEQIKKIYEKDEWIVDGSTRRLIQGGLEKADVIYHLTFPSILPQYYFLTTRYFKRKNEKITALFKMLRHVTYKKYKRGYGAHLPPLRDILKPYAYKVITLTSMREINKCIDSINSDLRK